jgi:hypothetical protein
LKFGIIRRRHTRFGGAERFLEFAYARLHQSTRAYEHGQPVA